MKHIAWVVLVVGIISLIGIGGVGAMELGVNVNERPELFDVALMGRAHATWGRAFIPVTPYFDRKLTVTSFPGIDRYKEAANAGFKMMLSLKNSFKSVGRRIPKPDSAEEAAYFEYVRGILSHLVPYTKAIVVGNEPFLEKQPADLQYDAEWQGYPIVIFYQRLTDVVYEYLQQHPELGNIPIYVGAFNRLHELGMQRSAAVQQMLRFAETDPRVAGIDLHPHVESLPEMAAQLAFARKYVTKPIIVTEYSLVWEYKKHNTELLGNSAEGLAFAQKYGLDPQLKVYQYINRLTRMPVPRQQWVDFLATRKWFNPRFLRDAYDIFTQYGVTIATYAFITAPEMAQATANADYTPWILNQIYTKLAYDPETGAVATNYGFFDDFAALSKGQ